MQLYIPSTKRAGNQITLRNLPEKLRKNAIVVVPHGEGESYAHQGIRSEYGAILVETLPATKGIGTTRQFIMEHAHANGVTQVCMLDDDLRFATRRTDDPTKFQDATPADITKLFDLISNRLSTKVPHVGVCTREGGNRMLEDAKCTRMLRILAYHVPTYIAAGIKYDRIHLMEDFDVTLQMLRAGMPNLVLHQYVHDQVASNAPGGCSTYRTLERQAQAAFKLAKLHPGFVKTVEKTTKTAWNGATRIDVVVAWKKAYASSGKVLA